MFPIFSWLGKVPLSNFRSARGSAFHRAIVIAFLIRAGDHRSIFPNSLNQILMSAIRTLLRHRFRRRSEFAFRIISAPVKSITLACPFFNEFAVFAERALHSDEVLLHILAFRISAARSELTETPMPQNQVALAQWASLIERNVGHLLALIKPPRSLAIGIASAGHELPKASA